MLYFKRYSEGDNYGYTIAEDKEIEDIIRIFRTPLNQEVIVSFTDQGVIESSISPLAKHILSTPKTRKRIKNEEQQ